MGTAPANRATASMTGPSTPLRCLRVGIRVPASGMILANAIDLCSEAYPSPSALKTAHGSSSVVTSSCQAVSILSSEVKIQYLPNWLRYRLPICWSGRRCVSLQAPAPAMRILVSAGFAMLSKTMFCALHVRHHGPTPLTWCKWPVANSRFHATRYCRSSVWPRMLFAMLLPQYCHACES